MQQLFRKTGKATIANHLQLPSLSYGRIARHRRQVSQLAARLRLSQSLQSSSRQKLSCYRPLIGLITLPIIRTKLLSCTDLQPLLVRQRAPPEGVVLDAPGLNLEPVLLVLSLRRTHLRRREDSAENGASFVDLYTWLVE